jgi:hypothetical protein
MGGRASKRDEKAVRRASTRGVACRYILLATSGVNQTELGPRAAGETRGMPSWVQGGEAGQGAAEQKPESEVSGPLFV